MKLNLAKILCIILIVLLIVGGIIYYNVNSNSNSSDGKEVKISLSSEEGKDVSDVILEVLGHDITVKKIVKQERVLYGDGYLMGLDAEPKPIAHIKAYLVSYKKNGEEFNCTLSSNSGTYTLITPDKNYNYDKLTPQMLSKYENNNNNLLEIIDIRDNLDGTVTLKLRSYFKSKIPSLTEEEYAELMEKKEIKIFDETFVLTGDNTITNNNYTSFDIDENKQLVSTGPTNFYKGLPTVYYITCSSDLTVKQIDGPEEEIIPILDYTDEIHDLEYFSGGYVITKYTFNEKGILTSIEKTF